MKFFSLRTERQLTPTLTQTGLLAVLLEHQRCKVIQLARRRAARKHLRAVFWSTLTWLRRTLMAQTLVPNSAKPLVGTAPDSNLSPEPIAMSPRLHTYTELRQQIHDDLRIQHPEWVEPDGQSSMCDFYEARLMELLHFDAKGLN
jgi:hypothetical protein